MKEGSVDPDVILRLAALPTRDALAELECVWGRPASNEDLSALLDAYEAEIGLPDDLAPFNLSAAVAEVLHDGDSIGLVDADDRVAEYLLAVVTGFARGAEARAEEAGLNPRSFGFGFGAGRPMGDISQEQQAELIADTVTFVIDNMLAGLLVNGTFRGMQDRTPQEVLAAAGCPREFYEAARATTFGLVINGILQGSAPNELPELVAAAESLAAVAADACRLGHGEVVEGPAAPVEAPPGYSATTPLGVLREPSAAAVLTLLSLPYMNQIGLPEGHLAYVEAHPSPTMASFLEDHAGSAEPMGGARSPFRMWSESPVLVQEWLRHIDLAAVRGTRNGARLAPGAIHSIIRGAVEFCQLIDSDLVAVPQYILAGGAFDAAYALHHRVQQMASKAVAFHAVTATPFYIPGTLMSAVADAEPLDPADLADLRLPYRANLVYFEQPIDVTAITRSPSASPVLAGEASGTTLVMPVDHLSGLVLFSEPDGTMSPLFMWIGSADQDHHLPDETIKSLHSAARWNWSDHYDTVDPNRPAVNAILDVNIRLYLTGEFTAGSEAGFVFQPAWLPDCDYPDIVHAAAALISWGDWRQPDPYTLPPEGTREHRKAIRSSAARKAITRGQTAGVNIAYLRPRTQPAPAPDHDNNTRKKTSPKAHLRRTHWRRSRVATRDETGDIVGTVHGAQGTDWHYVRHLIPAGVVNPTGAPADPDRVYKLVPRRS